MTKMKIDRGTVLRVVGRVLTLLLVLSLLLRGAFALFDKSEITENGCYVCIFDVGQSDAVFISCDGVTMLIDTGTATEERAFLAQLRDVSRGTLDYMLLSHPHEDHIGNARALMREKTVGTLLVPDTASNELAYTAVLQMAAERQTTIKTVTKGDCFSLGGAEIEVLQAGGNHENVNNDSVVIRVAYGQTVFLFMGDAEEECETALLAAYDAAHLDCDYLKVGHHGSNTATTAAFVSVSTPRFATIGCGENNDYGFPHAAVLSNLAAVNTTVLRTDRNGRILLASDGVELKLLSVEKKEE